MVKRACTTAALIAMSAVLFACYTPPASTAGKPTPQFGLSGGACVVGQSGFVSVQSTPVGQAGHALPTGQVSLSVDAVTVGIQSLAPDPIDGTTAEADFSFPCPVAGQHTYSILYNGDSVWHTTTQGGNDLLAIPPAPDMAADVSGGVISVGGVGCGQDASVAVYAGPALVPNPPQVATAEADVSDQFYWYTKIQLPSGSYQIVASCPDPLNNTLTYNPVLLTVP